MTTKSDRQNRSLLSSMTALVGLDPRRVRSVKIQAGVAEFATASLEFVRDDGTIEQVHKVLTEEGWRDYRPDR